jgi:hypothetical protein
MTDLRTLCLHTIVESVDDEECIVAVLDSLGSSFISHVEFILYMRRVARPQEEHWAQIPPILAKSNFKHLRELKFGIRGYESPMGGMKGCISRQLRSLGDILHVQSLFFRPRIHSE